jgi:hypothetical protein
VTKFAVEKIGNLGAYRSWFPFDDLLGIIPPTSASESRTTPLAPIPVTIQNKVSCSTLWAVVVSIVRTEKAASDANITRWIPRSGRDQPVDQGQDAEAGTISPVASSGACSSVERRIIGATMAP